MTHHNLIDYASRTPSIYLIHSYFMAQSNVYIRWVGCGLLNNFAPFRHFPNFFSIAKHTLGIEDRVDIRRNSAVMTPV